MRVRGGVRGWKALTRIALVGVIGGASAACSSDASRLGTPFSNPFSSEPAATGSLGEDGGDAVPTTAPAIRTPRIQSEALAAPGATMSPRPVPSAPPVSAAVSGMNPSGLNPDAGRAKAAIKAPAMTPRAAVSTPEPQTKLRFVQGAKPAAAKPVAVAETKPVAKPVEAKPVAKAAEAKPQAKVEPKVDAKKLEAARKAEAEAKAAKAEVAKEAAKKVAEAKAAEAAAKASVKEAKEAKHAAKETPAPAAQAPVKVASAEPVAVAPASTASDAFRWPAKGRIINGYGSAGNEGINIAVPEGTPVKAAEEGTVAYAGSDVKGYGKLVLVRHNNGFVSAYAHNGEIDVRPGEKVKRGQVIAKSGATGNVTSPQLHFEIRKGATPVDPMPHLGG